MRAIFFTRYLSPHQKFVTSIASTGTKSPTTAASRSLSIVYLNSHAASAVIVLNEKGGPKLGGAWGLLIT